MVDASLHQASVRTYDCTIFTFKARANRMSVRDVVCVMRDYYHAVYLTATSISYIRRNTWMPPCPHNTSDVT